MHPAFNDFLHNVTFWSALSAWIIAQVTKVLCSLAMSRRVGMDWLTTLGGMPSAHSAAVSALATSMGLHRGWQSPEFAFSIAFAVMIMIDASTVRRAAGLQARLLNEIVDKMFKEHLFSQDKLIELLGHTRLEVFLGLTMGIFAALLVNAAFALYA